MSGPGQSRRRPNVRCRGEAVIARRAFDAVCQQETHAPQQAPHMNPSIRGEAVDRQSKPRTHRPLPFREGRRRGDDTYRFDVQLSENASALVENGRLSRSRFQDLPAACLPLRVSCVPSAGTSTVHTP
jgi:hypothetical protein